jgi:hypothetical protein
MLIAYAFLNSRVKVFVDTRGGALGEAEQASTIRSGARLDDPETHRSVRAQPLTPELLAKR